MVPRPDIAHLADGISREGADFVASSFASGPARAFFDQFLVAALDGAIALAQMNGVAVLSPNT
jgi:putative heme iron utilization protein